MLRWGLGSQGGRRHTDIRLHAAQSEDWLHSSHEVVDLLQVFGVVELLHHLKGAPTCGLACRVGTDIDRQRDRQPARQADKAQPGSACA